MDATQLPIVVGNDGSDFARLALHKALWLADKLNAQLIVVGTRRRS